MGHATLLRDVYVGRGGFHPQAAGFLDAAYRDRGSVDLVKIAECQEGRT